MKFLLSAYVSPGMGKNIYKNKALFFIGALLCTVAWYPLYPDQVQVEQLTREVETLTRQFESERMQVENYLHIIEDQQRQIEAYKLKLERMQEECEQLLRSTPTEKGTLQELINKIRAMKRELTSRKKHLSHWYYSFVPGLYQFATGEKRMGLLFSGSFLFLATSTAFAYEHENRLREKYNQSGKVSISYERYIMTNNKYERAVRRTNNISFILLGIYLSNLGYSFYSMTSPLLSTESLVELVPGEPVMEEHIPQSDHRPTPVTEAYLRFDFRF